MLYNLAMLSKRAPQIDPQIQRHLVGLRNFAFTYALNAMNRELSEAQLIKIATKLFSHSKREGDMVMDAIKMNSEQTGHPGLACRAGCAFCCMQPTSASAPEVFAIYSHLKQTLSEKEQKVLVANLRTYDNAWKHFLSTEKSRAFRQMCPLNVKGQCSVYAVRPLACRGYTSTSSEACEQFYLAGDEDANIMGSFDNEQMIFSLRIGLGHALQSKGLPHHAYDLSTALLTCFDDPKCIEKFIEGKNPFAGSEIPTLPVWMEESAILIPLPPVN